jgi:hypothetical protein
VIVGREFNNALRDVGVLVVFPRQLPQDELKVSEKMRTAIATRVLYSTLTLRHNAAAGQPGIKSESPSAREI